MFHFKGFISYICLPLPPLSVAIHFASLLPSPRLSYQISFHPCPHLALIFLCILSHPTEGMQLGFDGACGGFSSSKRIRTCLCAENCISEMNESPFCSVERKSVKECSPPISREGQDGPCRRKPPPLGCGRKMRF